MIELYTFLIRHYICDWILQIWFADESGKHQLFAPRAHLHYLHNALGTVVVMLIFFPPWMCVAAVFDYFAHWLIDWTKTTYKVRVNPSGLHFHWMQVIDQIFHVSTYLLILMWANSY